MDWVNGLTEEALSWLGFPAAAPEPVAPWWTMPAELERKPLLILIGTVVFLIARTLRAVASGGKRWTWRHVWAR
jgi:hypothetical protein